MVNLPRSDCPTNISSRAHQQLIQEATKEQRRTSKELQASLDSFKINVHNSTIRKTLGKNGIHGRVARHKPLLTNKNTKACFTFTKKQPDDPQDFCDNYLRTDKSRVELFGRHGSRYICHETNTAFRHKNIITAVKHGDGSVMVWGCFNSGGKG